ncbi:MAG TPA: glycosyltransferase [Ktedonosporobacter sp.]|nr:glycosyltransferase [Ktedonosporobacter sp.]
MDQRAPIASAISVIICAHTEDRWYDLVAAVESVQLQTLPPREIIVVVDHNPTLFEQARSHFTGVQVIENKEPRGLSGARNSGIAQACGQIIAFLDDDAMAEPKWLEELCRPYSDPQVLGTGGAILPLWLTGRPAWLPAEFLWVVGCTYRGMPQVDSAIRNPIGANMSLRKEVFEQIGGFLSGIGRVGSRPIGCEETELCIRAQQHWPQGVFFYRPAARVQHRVPGNRTTWAYFRARCYAEGLSKAAISHYVGVKDSLASEQIYTREILPRGVVQGISDMFAYRDYAGLARAGSIVTGLIVTAAGYLVGKISFKRRETTTPARIRHRLPAQLVPGPSGLEHKT